MQNKKESQKVKLTEILSPLLGQPFDQALMEKVISAVANSDNYVAIDVVRENDGSLCYLRNMPHYEDFKDLDFPLIEVISVKWVGNGEGLRLDGVALTKVLTRRAQHSMLYFEIEPSKEDPLNRGMRFVINPSSLNSGFKSDAKFTQPEEILLRISGYKNKDK